MAKKLNVGNDLFFDTNKQKVLKFLVQRPSQFLITSEIVGRIRVSKAGANIALRRLVESGLVKRSVKGRVHLYQVDSRNPLIKQFKVMECVAELYSLIGQIKDFSQQIILFGSAARGENIEDSDIDLFVLTREDDKVRSRIKKFDKNGKIKAVLKTPTSFAKLERNDSVFYHEIQRGITLFERYE